MPNRRSPKPRRQSPRARATGWLLPPLLRLWRILPLPDWLRAQAIWWTNQHYMVAVAALIWDDDGRLLLGRHTYLPGSGWSLLGGGLHGIESPAQGMARELAEELGGDVEVGPAVAWATLPRPRRVVVGFRCYWRGGEFRPNAEIAEVAYFSVEQALGLARRDARALIEIAARQHAAERKAAAPTPSG
jgi:ADP-ribose pyrophosphatase YjhB (NUDIX family)